ncbi:Vesicle-fusing ATPase [Plasmodiophora brassicae]|uniref:Vesicle-fusing ATPase n=1 Tax=Plasmodiophora brassicae TaxID=37360 RepID=A0A3P3Y4W3_PLABS|nr:unnamed protein product [Plasmodiophora brassicae]
MTSTTLQVANVPGNQYVFTNAVYVHPSSAALVVPAYQGGAFVILNDDIVYEIKILDQIEPGNIGMNALQRAATRVSIPGTLQAKPLNVPDNVNMNLAVLQFEISPISKAKSTLDEDALVQHFHDKLSYMIWSVGQALAIDYQGTSIKVTVLHLEIAEIGGAKSMAPPRGVILKGTTMVSFETTKRDTLITLQKSRAQARSNILRPSFKFADMGIGGLDEEFGQIFRRAFASRTFPPDVIQKLGISHVRGMLLHGPPGTGKTLIARQIGKMLHGREPKVVNGPEILNKFVGASEENIRKLFEDAEADYAQNGEHADLHIIIFDEIDAICKQRGSTGSSTGVHDTVVNQLLSKIDGVNSLNNILVIGMTNRKDMIDEALLRPGRLEVHVEIGLPDENGRHDILMIHTKAMRDSGCLDPDVDLRVLAAKTKNFSGAEIAGLVKSATSFALYGNVDIKSADSVAVRSTSDVLVKMAHFEQALLEVVPAFGVSEDELRACVRNGLVNYGPPFDKILEDCRSFINQIKNSEQTPLLSLLLHGEIGCGKTAIAAQLAMESGVPFIKLITPDDFVGLSENEKVSRILKVFRDAYKSPVSIIILDNIERLLDYTRIGPRFSNTVLQALLVLIKKQPPSEKRRLLIIGTTSNSDVMKEMQFDQVFDSRLAVPQIQYGEEVLRVFQEMKVRVNEADATRVISSMHYPIGIKTLLLVIEMALQAGNGVLTYDNFAHGLQTCTLTRAVAASPPILNGL